MPVLLIVTFCHNVKFMCLSLAVTVSCFLSYFDSVLYRVQCLFLCHLNSLVWFCPPVPPAVSTLLSLSLLYLLSVFSSFFVVLSAVDLCLLCGFLSACILVKEVFLVCAAGPIQLCHHAACHTADPWPIVLWESPRWCKNTICYLSDCVIVAFFRLN